MVGDLKVTVNISILRVCFFFKTHIIRDLLRFS